MSSMRAVAIAALLLAVSVACSGSAWSRRARQEHERVGRGDRNGRAAPRLRGQGRSGVHEGLRLERPERERSERQRPRHVRGRFDQHRRGRHEDRRRGDPPRLDRQHGREHGERGPPVHGLGPAATGEAGRQRAPHRRRRRHADRRLAGRSRRKRRPDRGRTVHHERDRNDRERSSPAPRPGADHDRRRQGDAQSGLARSPPDRGTPLRTGRSRSTTRRPDGCCSR